MSVEISEIERSDLEAVSKLYQQLIPNEVSIPRMESVFERNINNPNHIALVARKNDFVAGTILANICEMYFGRCKSFMVVEDFVVDEQHRGKGVGKALMKHIEKIAKKQNCSYIMLITDSDRKDSQKFYSSLGYSSDEYCAFKKKL